MRITSFMRDEVTFYPKTKTETHGEPIYTYTEAAETVPCQYEGLPGRGLFASLARMETDVRCAVHLDPTPSAVMGAQVVLRGRRYSIRDIDDARPDRWVLILKEVVRG